MKKTLILLFASLVLTGCGGSLEEGYEDGKDAASEVEDEVVKDVELVEVEVEADDELTRDQSIRLVELMMAESFEETGEVGYSIIHDALAYTPTDPQFSYEMTQMALGTLDRSDWDGLVENFRELSGVVSDNVDEDLGVVIMNPDNVERVILIVRDGVVMYDFMDDL